MCWPSSAANRPGGCHVHCEKEAPVWRDYRAPMIGFVREDNASHGQHELMSPWYFTCVHSSPTQSTPNTVQRGLENQNPYPLQNPNTAAGRLGTSGMEHEC